MRISCECRRILPFSTDQVFSLVSRKELAVAFETRGYGGLDGHHPTRDIARHDEIVWKSVKEMKRCLAAVRETRRVDAIGLRIAECGVEAMRAVCRTDAARTSECLVFLLK